MQAEREGGLGTREAEELGTLVLEALDLKQASAKIQEQPDTQTGRGYVMPHLAGFMVANGGERLELHDDVATDEVRPEGHAQWAAVLVVEGDVDLVPELDAPVLELVDEGPMVSRLKEPPAERAVHLDGSADDGVRERVELGGAHTGHKRGRVIDFPEGWEKPDARWCFRFPGLPQFPSLPSEGEVPK
jgi:hypothetical protein